MKPYELLSALTLSTHGGICDGGPGWSCSGQGVLQILADAADMMADATQDPTRQCDGISFGATFEAVASNLALDDVSAPLPEGSCWCTP